MNTSHSHPRISVLDHGYIQLVEFWGSDERIIESARMSTNKGFQGWGPKHASSCPYFVPDENADRLSLAFKDCNCLENTPGDEKLLSYLYSHKHMTPFEMCGLTLEIQAPIFVFREWHRHRTQSYNEMSARYTPLPDMSYTPTVERCLLSGGANKQAQGTSGTSSVQLTERGAQWWIKDLNSFYMRTQQLYQEALSAGVPKELARLCIPVARYSKMRASANLRNWLAFLTLRMDEAAQWEIRQYANIVGDIISQLFPRTWGLFIGESK